ncbi:hypothetical protein B0T26DRAFT_747295 [Lasiosphaeria miniovina]|uniref:Uncharacterized protein n=1 Tax=Lasiosphaeria miniovina TaxID=1954250 RepID=A0AA40E937_9PEZI|nr:uncharacterized protein B0T26DRAFT_747295 [Lasiosphaeria miniovina]KAK0726903.1 hypothetical protein B0T26DRAFT_747295 [Lasiosphaeria miniovina]
MHKNGTGRIIYITSDSGSIGCETHSISRVDINTLANNVAVPNPSGNVIGYRMAKSAANQQVKTLAIDFKRGGIPVSTLAFEPGFIKTRLSGDTNIVESCPGTVDIIERMAPDMPGAFLDWQGNTVPW